MKKTERGVPVEDNPGFLPRRRCGEKTFSGLGKASAGEISERELEVLKELVSGASNKCIAERMNLSVDAVKYHLKNLLKKTGCQTRTELAVKACLSGILPPEESI